MQEITYDLKNGLLGVVSDTHVPARAFSLPSRLFQLLEGVDLILHAGDLEDKSVINELSVIAPVEAVAGNMDPPNLKEKLGTEKIIHIGKVSLGLTHGAGAPRGVPELVLQRFKGYKINALIFGHSHISLLEQLGDILVLNPGSATDPRRGSPPSCARLLIEGSTIRGELLFL